MMMHEKKTILVVDDDPGILDALTFVLEDAGYAVETNTDGAILQNVNTISPDLLLLDVWLSGWNGRDICLALKSNEQTRHLPIILFSANREIETLAQEAGADDFIVKPFDLDDVLDKIARLVGPTV